MARSKASQCNTTQDEDLGLVDEVRVVKLATGMTTSDKMNGGNWGVIALPLSPALKCSNEAPIRDISASHSQS